MERDFWVSAVLGGLALVLTLGVIAVILRTVWAIIDRIVNGPGEDPGERRQAAYRRALSALASEPDDHRLRVAALTAGRRYYGGLRDDGRPTTYDEQAIANDLSARSRG